MYFERRCWLLFLFPYCKVEASSLKHLVLVSLSSTCYIFHKHKPNKGAPHNYVLFFPGSLIGLLLVFPETIARKSLQAPHDNNAPGRLLRRPQIHHRVRLQRGNWCLPGRTPGKLAGRYEDFAFLVLLTAIRRSPRILTHWQVIFIMIC